MIQELRPFGELWIRGRSLNKCINLKFVRSLQPGKSIMFRSLLWLNQSSERNMKVYKCYQYHYHLLYCTVNKQFIVYSAYNDQ
jgi:hypothetical protein